MLECLCCSEKYFTAAIFLKIVSGNRMHHRIFPTRMNIFRFFYMSASTISHMLPGQFCTFYTFVQL